MTLFNVITTTNESKLQLPLINCRRDLYFFLQLFTVMNYITYYWVSLTSSITLHPYIMIIVRKRRWRDDISQSKYSHLWDTLPLSLVCAAVLAMDLNLLTLLSISCTFLYAWLKVSLTLLTVCTTVEISVPMVGMKLVTRVMSLIVSSPLLTSDILPFRVLTCVINE